VADEAKSKVVQINYRPRVWARRMHDALLEKQWAVLVLHRRAGKTTSELNQHQRAAMDDGWEIRRLTTQLPQATPEQVQALLKNRVYWHVMPTYSQAKKTGWEMMKDYARPIPGVRFNESELLVVYPNGSRIQLVGGDSPDSLRGPGLSGLSLDEYSQIPPNVFSEVLSKSLADHAGYCIFSGTIKGTDQLYDTYHKAQDDPKWFSLWQTVDGSLATEDGATIVALQKAMESERDLIAKGHMLQSDYDQEWYLSASAAIKGAFYAQELQTADREGRITSVPYDPGLPVNTDWDLGVDDAMTIWFSQTSRGGEVRLIDYYEASGEGLPHYIKYLAKKPYVYGTHGAPHDIAVRELGTGKSRLETAKALGITFKPTPPLPFDDGIEAARLLLARCWFDAQKCEHGLSALRNYRKSWNQRTNMFIGTPVHNWASHGADAFRYLSVRHKMPKEGRTRKSSGRSFAVGEGAWLS